MWVEFDADFDFHPEAEVRVTIEYKAGMRCQVTRECADKSGARAIRVSKADADKLRLDPFWRADGTDPTPSEQDQV